MILEGLVTSVGPTGEMNVAPMGPIVDDALTTLVLRPFTTSHTCRNLRAHPSGVFHVVDDVLLLAQAALDRLAAPPDSFPAERVPGFVLAAACRWYEFVIDADDVAEPRPRMTARVVHAGRIRDFFGFNRAKHAVLEATILATRMHLMPRQDLLEQLERLRIPVDKTAGPREREAFELVWSHVAGAPELPQQK